MKGCAIALLSMLLTACASQSAPEPRTVRVDVPVPVPCEVAQIAVPAWATASLRQSDSLQTKVRALLAERLQRQAYERQLLAASHACQ